MTHEALYSLPGSPTAEPTGVDGAEQPGQDEDLEDDVGLDNEGAGDEESLAEEIEIADQLQS